MQLFLNGFVCGGVLVGLICVSIFSQKIEQLKKEFKKLELEDDLK